MAGFPGALPVYHRGCRPNHHKLFMGCVARSRVKPASIGPTVASVSTNESSKREPLARKERTVRQDRLSVERKPGAAHEERRLAYVEPRKVGRRRGVADHDRGAAQEERGLANVKPEKESRRRVIGDNDRRRTRHQPPVAKNETRFDDKPRGACCDQRRSPYWRTGFAKDPRRSASRNKPRRSRVTKPRCEDEGRRSTKKTPSRRGKVSGRPSATDRGRTGATTACRRRLRSLTRGWSAMSASQSTG